MTPRKILEGLCSRHGLPPEKGERLLPLVRRAATAPEEVRARILELVERSLRREAERYRSSQRERDLDERMLGVIAKIVHPWTPPAWLQVWSRKRRDDEDEGDERDIA